MSEMFRGGFTAVVVIIFMVIVNVFLFVRAKRRKRATDDINSVRDFHQRFGIKDPSPDYIVKAEQDNDTLGENRLSQNPTVISSARAMNDQYTYHYLKKHR